MSDDFNIGSGDDTHKPAYDGRLMYYDVMKKVMLMQKVSALSGDNMQWYRSLRELFSMCKPYIDQDKAKTISNKLSIAQRELSLINTTYNPAKKKFLAGSIENQLLTIGEDLHVAAREVFLPVKSSELGKWSDEDFLRGSNA